MNNCTYNWQKNSWQQLLDLRAKLPQALLIHGPVGIGKQALAEAFAQVLLCEASGELRAPCGRCEGCRWFLAGSHPDVRFLGINYRAHEEYDGRGDASAVRSLSPIRSHGGGPECTAITRPGSISQEKWPECP